MNLQEFILNLFKKRVENLLLLVLFVFKFTDRLNMCCSSIITSPIPNSTAESIKKKNVSESRFILSYTNPIIRTSE